MLPRRGANSVVVDVSRSLLDSNWLRSATYHGGQDLVAVSLLPAMRSITEWCSADCRICGYPSLMGEEFIIARVSERPQEQATPI